MNDFDLVGRRLIKDDPLGHLRWLFPGLPRQRLFRGWLDSQSAPRPGERDRRCDTIAEMVHTRGTRSPLALVVEQFSQGDPDAVDRSLEYLARFRRELRHGPYHRDRYDFAVALIFLTDVPGERELQMSLEGHRSQVYLRFKPRVLALASEDAVAHLQQIEENRVSWGILPWLVLMQQGQGLDFARRWRTALERLVSDSEQQKQLADITVVLAQLTDCQGIYRQVLEGLAVNESNVMQALRSEGRKQGQQAFLLHVLKRLAGGTVPETLVSRVQEQTDSSVLLRWLDLATEAQSLEAFVESIDR